MPGDYRVYLDHHFGLCERRGLSPREGHSVVIMDWTLSPTGRDYSE